MQRPGFLIGGGRRAGIWRPVAGAVLMALALAACQTGGGSGERAATEFGNPPPVANTRMAQGENAPAPTPRPRRSREALAAELGITAAAADRARELAKLAAQAKERKDYQQALAHLDEMDGLVGEMVISTLLRGSIWVHQKRPDRSLPLFEKAESKGRNPGEEWIDGMIYLGIGESLLMFGDMPGAIDYLSQAERILRRKGKPLLREARQLRIKAMGLREMPRPLPASAGYTEDTEARNLVIQAIKDAKRGQLDAADYKVKKAFILDPHSKLVNYGAGLILSIQKKFNQAEGLLNRALYIAMQDGDRRFQGMALDTLGSNYMVQKEYAGAAHRLRDAIPLLRQAGEAKLANNAERNLKEAERKARAAEPRTGRRAARNVPSRRHDRTASPASSGVVDDLMPRVLKALDAGDYAGAERLLRRMAEGSENRPDIWTHFAWVLSRQQKYGEALEAYEHAHRITLTMSGNRHLALKPDAERARATAMAGMGRMNVLLGDVGQGERQVLRGIGGLRKLNAHLDVAVQHQFLATIYHNAGRRDEALVQARDAVDAYTDAGAMDRSATVHLIIADIQLERERYAAAMRALNIILKYGSEQREPALMAKTHAYVGIAQYALGDHDAACTHLRSFRRMSSAIQGRVDDRRAARRLWDKIGCDRYS